MKKVISWQNTIALAIAFLTLFCSCSPGGVIDDPYYVNEDRQRENTYYVPAAPHLPLVLEQQDLNFNLLRASGNKFNGLEAQAAYMPWKKVALGVSVSTGRHKEGGLKMMEYNRFELMWGYIKKIDKLWAFETYAGLGTGKITNYHFTGHSTIKPGHYFIQPAIAVGNDDKTVQLVFASRFAGVNFNVTDTLFITDREQFSGKQLNSLYDEPVHMMWEPALLFRAGWKNIMFTLQYSHSSDLTNSSLHRSSDNFSFGISVRGNTKSK